MFGSDNDAAAAFAIKDALILPPALLASYFDYLSAHSPTTNPIPHVAIACVEAPVPDDGGALRRVFCRVSDQKQAPPGEVILPEWMLSVLGVPPGTVVALCA